MSSQTDLEIALDSFDREERQQALRALMETTPAPAASSDNVNMHIHTFYSYNAEAWSPSHVAWGCRQQGLHAAGIIDFDVLDGLEEFYAAGEWLGLRTNVGLETRVYYREFADHEIDSPGEPGVHYIDGVGFTRVPEPGTPEATTLAAYRENAQRRNLALVQRINPHVSEIAVDYMADVLPLTPGGAPTERHIIAAYVNKAQTAFPESTRLVDYWRGLLGLERETVEALIADRPALEERVRSKLAKQGGYGYETPTEATFPPMEDFCAWVRACGAMPMESWLDGTSSGEQQAERLLDTSLSKGCVCFSIVPDRNWNIKNPDEKAKKVANLRRVVELCADRHLPINIGTEMNKRGLPFVDDLDGPVLREFKAPFIEGAQILVGHSIAGRFADFPYVGPAAEQAFPNRRERNAFYAKVGALPPVDQRIGDALRAMGTERAYGVLHDSAAAGQWRI